MVNECITGYNQFYLLIKIVKMYESLEPFLLADYLNSTPKPAT